MTWTNVPFCLAAVTCVAIPAWIFGGTAKPQTQREFECYVGSAETRMDARRAFLLADADPVLNRQLISERRIATLAPNGPNPHKLNGGHLYDWIGAAFIPGTRIERLVQMLQDYDHRAQYFPATIATSKLLCRSGKDHFRYTMRLKEPAVIDIESDVVWEQVDAQHWRCRSYSTKTSEVGKDHGYLRQLYSYWRFAEAEKGVYVEAETITLSDEFGGMSRALGSMVMGINPEKSLKHSLESMRESILKPGLAIPSLQEGLPSCGPTAARPSDCATPTGR